MSTGEISRYNERYLTIYVWIYARYSSSKKHFVQLEQSWAELHVMHQACICSFMKGCYFLSSFAQKPRPVPSIYSIMNSSDYYQLLDQYNWPISCCFHFYHSAVYIGHDIATLALIRAKPQCFLIELTLLLLKIRLLDCVQFSLATITQVNWVYNWHMQPYTQLNPIAVQLTGEAMINIEPNPLLSHYSLDLVRRISFPAVQMCVKDSRAWAGQRKSTASRFMSTACRLWTSRIKTKSLTINSVV